MTQQGLLNLILANIPDNIVQAIEPADVRSILNNIVNTLFENIFLASASYGGPAATTTDPGTPTTPVFYTASSAGTYTNFKDSTGTAITIASGEYLVFLSFNGTAWIKQVINIDLSGYAAQGDVDAINEKLDDSDANFGALDDFSTYTSNGTTTPITILSRLHAVSGDATVNSISLQCIVAGTLKVNFWRLISGTSYKCIANFIFTCTSGLNTFTAGTDFDAFDVKEGDRIAFTETGSATVKYKPKTGGDASISSTTFAVGDTLTAAADGNAEFAISANATIKGISTSVSENTAAVAESIRDADLTLVDSINLAKDEYKVLNVGIYNSQKNTAAGWICYRIPVTPGQIITFGNFTFTGNAYGQAAFYDDTDDPGTMGSTGFISASANYFNADIPLTLTVPDNAAWLYFDVARSGDPSTQHDKVMANLGSTLADYVSSNQLVDAIKGYGLNSGGTSDVQKFSDLTDVPAYSGNAGKGLKIKDAEDGLDTFALVEADTDVSFASITATGLSVDLPSGAGTEPAGLSVGDAWIDTTDGTIKVKLS